MRQNYKILVLKSLNYETIARKFKFLFQFIDYSVLCTLWRKEKLH